MATDSTPAADADNERTQARLSFVRLLRGPAVLLLGGALISESLFLPWYHSDARYLVGDRYPGDFLPFVPAQAFGGDTNLYWLRLGLGSAAIPIIAALVCPLVDAAPFLRRPGLLRGSGVLFGFLTLVTGGVGFVLLLLYPGFLSLAGTVPKILDGGYFMSLAGYFLLVPGAVLLMIGQSHVRQMVRPGKLRAA